MILEIEGMHCDACVRRVTQALARTDAGQLGVVSLGRAEIAAPAASGPKLIAALANAGFVARMQTQ